MSRPSRTLVFLAIDLVMVAWSSLSLAYGVTDIVEHGWTTSSGFWALLSGAILVETIGELIKSADR